MCVTEALRVTDLSHTCLCSHVGSVSCFALKVRRSALAAFDNRPSGVAMMSSGLTKTILQGTAKGGRKRGRQRKRWEDNIKEWTGLEFAKSQRAVENGENGGNWL